MFKYVMQLHYNKYCNVNSNSSVLLSGLSKGNNVAMLVLYIVILAHELRNAYAYGSAKRWGYNKYSMNTLMISSQTHWYK